jgi:hypothetical protein
VGLTLYSKKEEKIRIKILIPPYPPLEKLLLLVKIHYNVLADGYYIAPRTKIRCYSNIKKLQIVKIMLDNHLEM